MVQNSAEGDRAERVVLRSLSPVLPGTEFGIKTGDPAGEGISGHTTRREASRLSIELDPFVATDSLRPGALVEMRTARFLYLGHVRALRDRNLTVILEHAVDLGLLDAIQHIWNRPKTGEGGDLPAPARQTTGQGPQ